MKFFFYSIIIFCLSSFTYNYIESTNSLYEDREALIEKIAADEAELAKASCFCRIGLDKGPSLKEYPYSLKDLGRVQNFSGAVPVNDKNEDICSRTCAKVASDYLRTLSYDKICQYAKKTGTQYVLAYSKIGGRNWTVCGGKRQAKCCNTSSLVCPEGTWSENKNFPGMCGKPLCKTSAPNTRLYNERGNVWGFIWEGSFTKLVRGKVSSSGWRACD